MDNLNIENWHKETHKYDFYYNETLEDNFIRFQVITKKRYRGRGEYDVGRYYAQFILNNPKELPEIEIVKMLTEMMDRNIELLIADGEIREGD